MKFQRLTRSGCEDIRIIKFEFVAKTELLCVPSVIAFLAYLRKIVSILFYFILFYEIKDKFSHFLPSPVYQLFSANLQES